MKKFLDCGGADPYLGGCRDRPAMLNGPRVGLVDDVRLSILGWLAHSARPGRPSGGRHPVYGGLGSAVDKNERKRMLYFLGD